MLKKLSVCSQVFVECIIDFGELKETSSSSSSSSSSSLGCKHSKVDQESAPVYGTGGSLHCQVEHHVRRKKI